MRTPLRILTALLLPLALVAACGDDADEAGTDTTDGTGAADGGDEPAPTVPDGAEPGGLPGEVFLQIEHVGGFVPVGADFQSVPSVTVYADGTVVVPGATIAIFPGPAVAPLAIGALDDEDLDELLGAVASAGLLAEVPPDPGENQLVADAATTRITVVVDGRDTVVEAYALDIPVPDDAPGIDDDQRAVRERLVELVATVSDAATTRATDLYEPTGYRVLALEPFETDPSIEPDELTWPAEGPQPVLDECVAITGDAAAAVAQLVAGATEITRWTVGAEQVTLRVRPMLPHEDGC
jgi:hypothetical protein